MLNSYIKTGLRAIQRQKLPTLLNAGGMAIAIGCCLVVYAFFDLALRCDDFHPNVDRIAAAHRVLDNNGSPERWCDTPEPFGPALQAETPFVEQICRFSERSGLVREADGDVFREQIAFVDTTFFGVFDFSLKWGRKEDFQGREALILSQEMSEKYFGTENPVGRRLAIRFSEKEQSFESQYQIVGVTDKIPLKSSFEFQALVPFEAQRNFGRADFSDWKRSVDVTFVLTHSLQDLAKLPAAASRYVAVQNQADPVAPAKSFGFVPLNVITTEGATLRRSIFNNAHISVLILLGSIAVAMMLLVCFNYINIAMAAATVRLREISVRKVMGGSRRQIIAQFLAENALICLAALGMGLLLAHWVFQPWFNSLIDADLAVDYADPVLWIFLAVLLTVSVLGAAAYPAFYISALQPVTIFKNKIRLGEKNLLRRALVGLQFVLTFVTLFCATVMLVEGPRLRSKSWGYQQNDLLVMRLPESKAFAALKNDVLRLPNVMAVAGSGGYFGGGAKAVTVEIEGANLQVNELVAGPDYLEALDVPLVAGQNFHLGNPNEAPEATVLVNTAFRRSMGWSDVEGKNLRLAERQYRIAGELPDFYYSSFGRKIAPAVVRLCGADELRYLTLRVRPGTAAATMPALQSLWKTHFPDAPCDVFYQNAVFESYFRGLGNITNLMSATASLAILLSACGIFGLAMLRLMRRLREMSVRRVLGADIWHFSRLVSEEFVWLLVVAGVLGTALGFVVMQAIMEMFSAGHVLAPLLPTALTFAALLLVTMGACGFHLWRLWRFNPVQALKDE